MKRIKVGPELSRLEIASRTSNITSLHTEEDKSSVKKWCIHLKTSSVILVSIAGWIMFSFFALSRAMNVQLATKEAINKLELTLAFSAIVQYLQRERGMSTSFLVTDNATFATVDKIALNAENIEQILQSVKWPPHGIKWHNIGLLTEDRMIESLKQHRSKVENRTVELLYNLEYYTNLTKSLINHIKNYVTLKTDSGIQRSIDASSALLLLTDDVGIQRALGTIFFTGCGWSSEYVENYFMQLHGRSSAFLDIALSYYKKMEFQYFQAIQNPISLAYVIDRDRTYELFRNYEALCISYSKLEKEAKSLEWFQNMTVYIDMYFDIREEMNTYIKYSLKSLQEYSIIEFVMYFIILVTSVIVSCFMVLWYTHKIANLTETLADYLHKVQQRSTELATEKKKSEEMLHQILPKRFARDLVLEKPVFAQHFTDVTVYFSSICGFNEIETRSNPLQIVHMLTDLHRLVKYLYLKTYII